MSVKRSPGSSPAPFSLCGAYRNKMDGMLAPQRRLRVVLPDKVSAAQLRALCDDTGAIDASCSDEADAHIVTVSFPGEEPAWLEDRVEAWLDLVDPFAQAQLETALGEGD